MKDNNQWLKDLDEVLLHAGGAIDDARETLDAVFREAPLRKELGKDVKASAADLREVYQKLGDICDEIRMRTRPHRTVPRGVT